MEQKISRKGEITAEVCSYEIAVGKMQRSPLSSIPMGTQITTYAFSPDQEKLFLGTVDRNICLYDLVMQTTKCVAQIDIVSRKHDFSKFVSYIAFSFRYTKTQQHKIMEYLQNCF